MSDQNPDERPDGRQEPTLDLNPKTDRTPDSEALDQIMGSLDGAFDEANALSEVEEKLRGEIATLKDQLLRSLAEVENVRRRVEREKQDATKYAVANFAKAVLSVADNLERALAAAPAEARETDETLKNLCIGLELTQSDLKSALERFGVKPVEAQGKKLDPNLHQAMFEIEDPSVAAGTIVQVMQTGYVIHDRLLRPAMVGVAKGGPREMPANENPAQANSASTGAANAYAKTDQANGDDKPNVDTKL